jgi:hypothetical protein
MSFGEFARQYLNPILLFFRICWLGMAAICFLIGSSVSELNMRLGAYGLAAILCWCAIRRWKLASLRDVERKLIRTTREIASVNLLSRGD